MDFTLRNRQNGPIRGWVEINSDSPLSLQIIGEGLHVSGIYAYELEPCSQDF